MFPKNTYLIPQLSAVQGRASSSSVLDLNDPEILYHHHHHQQHIFSAHNSNLGCYSNAHQVLDPSMLFSSSTSHDTVGRNIIGDPSLVIVNSTFRDAKQTAKRDRHSKIYTSQGPRDRRVRLSIGIARKFFDLQELLGFDKPSKTLGWLLTKSKSAIKDLEKSQGSGSCAKIVSSPGSECDEVVSDEAALETEKCSLVAESKRKAADASKGSTKDILAKESRAKARARARERTREKMCMKQLSDQATNITGGINYQYNYPCNSIQYMNNHLEFCKTSGPNSSILRLPLNYEELPCHDDIIQESIVIKRKVKQPSFFGFPPNLMLSRDPNAASSVAPSVNAVTESWDLSGINAQYTFVDHHRFSNSSSNI